MADAIGNLGGKSRAGNDVVDEPPLDRPLAANAFGERDENIRQIAPDAALVEQARQASGARQHAKKRNLGQTDGRASIIDEPDVLAGQRELVAAAAGDAVESRDVALPRQG